MGCYATVSKSAKKTQINHFKFYNNEPLKLEEMAHDLFPDCGTLII